MKGEHMQSSTTEVKTRYLKFLIAFSPPTKEVLKGVCRNFRKLFMLDAAWERPLTRED